MAKDYYVYMYLDRGISGPFEYDWMSFNYLPRYVGKGRDKRVKLIKAHGHNIGVSSIDDIEIVKLSTGLDNDSANLFEKHIIKIIGRLCNDGPLFNLTDGGGGTEGRCYKPTQKTIDKLKLLVGSKNPNFGKKWSQDMRHKMSKRVKGKLIPANTGDKHWSFGLFGRDNPTSKEYIISTPDGGFFDIKGLKCFCRENGLSASSMVKVTKGIQSMSKGYKCWNVPCILSNQRNK